MNPIQIKDTVLEEAEKTVRAFFEERACGHDWWHVHRVRQMALHLAKSEALDEEQSRLCSLCAILHDVGDAKLHPNSEAGLQFLERVLNQLSLTPILIQSVKWVIESASFSSSLLGPKENPFSFEGDAHLEKCLNIAKQILSDADRLDALGAIGIARTFAYGGSKGQLMYDPEIPARENLNLKSYREEKSTSINHFYEKLLKLKDGLYTQSAQQIAVERHEFMESYLKQFLKEWEG